MEERNASVIKATENSAKERDSVLSELLKQLVLSNMNATEQASRAERDRLDFERRQRAEHRERYEIWKETSELDVIFSTPFSISGSLLALGGRKDGKDSTTIQLYQPETGKWLKVGDLPHPRSLCTSAMINDREMMVVGEGSYVTSRTDIALINY